MTQFCGPFDPAGPYVRGVLSFVDCQAANLAEQGYRAIGAGTQFTQALDGVLIVAVAVFGYRMLLGEAPALRDGALLVFKMGLILALTQHWSAYQPVVFDFATRVPQELVSSMLGQGRGSTGQVEVGLAERVDTVDTAIGAVLHPESLTGPAPLAAPRPPIAGTADPNLAGPELAPDVREMLASADNTLLLTVLASNIGIRVALAVLLAIAPMFIATLLFGTSRTLFAGWIRATVGTMIAAVAVPIVTAFELALLEPQVGALLRAFGGGQALGALPERLWVTTAAFAAAMVLAGLLIARAAATIHFPQVVRLISERLLGALPVVKTNGAPSLQSHPILTTRDHAQRIADAARTAERRDDLAGSTVGTKIIERDHARRQSRAWQRPTAVVAAHGHARAASGRKSAAAQRRDES